ncbi:MAG TPA: transglutaminase domain-containing protein [Pirellulales bacterium]|jgi:transglutaminase-like putative cysteine protease|nr:transglutaminase domain-containing protein [Pirellulales bacterium]
MTRRISTSLAALLFAALWIWFPSCSLAQSADDDELEASIVEDADDEAEVATTASTKSRKTSFAREAAADASAGDSEANSTESSRSRDAAAGERRPGADSALRYTDPRTYRLKIVVRVDAPEESLVKNVVAVAPIPRDWPEQKVRLLSRKISEGAKYKEFDKPGQCKTFNFQIPQIAAGESAGVESLYEITRWRIVYAADDDDELSLPHGAPREVREQFSGPAPGLEMKHPKIKELARDLKQRHEDEGAWNMVKGFWKWTRDNVVFKNGDFRGALFAVEEHCGDCEEMSALFVSMCRLSGGVARSVWVEGHNYPEFYLLDKQGRGHWIPAQVVGPAWFGEMVEYRPIFQKGDRFLDPFKGKFVRYTPQTVKAEGKVEPKLVVEHQIISDQDIMDPDYRNPIRK